jgi:hypothetical protein
VIHIKAMPIPATKLMSPVAVRKQERCDDSDVKGIRSEEDLGSLF